jgi:hypothetical protein
MDRSRRSTALATPESSRFLSVGAYEICDIPAKSGNVDPVAVWYSGCCSESVNVLQNTLMDVPQHIVRLYSQ